MMNKATNHDLLPHDEEIVQRQNQVSTRRQSNT